MVDKQHFDDDEKVYEVDDSFDNNDAGKIHDLGASSNSDFDEEDSGSDDFGDDFIDADEKGIEFGDEYGDDEYGDGHENKTVEFGDEYGDDYGDEFGDEYGDEYGEEPIYADQIPASPIVGETEIEEDAEINPSSVADEKKESSDVRLDVDGSQDMIPNGEVCAPENRDTTEPMKEESDASILSPPVVTIDVPQPQKTDRHVSSSNGGTSNLSLAEMIVAKRSSEATKQEAPPLSLAEMIAERSQAEKASSPTTMSPVQPQSPNPSPKRGKDVSEIDSSNLSLAQMIALRSGGKKINQSTKQQTATSPSILHLISPSKDEEQTDSSVDPQDDSSSSMSLAQMIAARSQTGTTPQESSAPTLTNIRGQLSEPKGKKQSHVYKNKANMMKQKQQRQQQKPTRNPIKTTKRQTTTPSKLVSRPTPMSKSTPSAPPPSIPCTFHRRQDASLRVAQHEPWRRFESRRRIQMRYRRKIVEQEWQGAADILNHGIASTKLAERIVLGFVKASKQMALDFKATSEDSVFNDSGKVVQTIFTQRRLSKIRNSAPDVTGIFGSSSPILAACLECYGILAEQAETLEEKSRQMSAEYPPKLRRVIAELERAVDESEYKAKRILEEFDRYENNTVSSWAIVDTFESLLPPSLEQKKKSDTPKNLTKSDGWFIQQSYSHSVLLQQNYLLGLKEKMDEIGKRVKKLEHYRLREVRSILLDGFYKKQLELFEQLPLFENEMVKNMTDAKIDEDSLEEILHDRSKTRLKFSQSHRSSILNRSSLQIAKQLEPAVASIEGEFGSPLDSAAVLLATVVELQRSGTTLSSFVSVSWKRTLAVVLDTEIVCFLELPRAPYQAEKESAEDAFHSLLPDVQFGTKTTRRKKQDLLGSLGPFLSWRLSKCSVDISNIQDRIVEVTEVGRRMSSPNLLLLGKRGDGSGDDNNGDGDGSSTQVETKYSLRFSSAADASKWLGAFEKTKGKLHIASDESISAASSISVGTSVKTFGTFGNGEGNDDDDSNGIAGDDNSNGTQDGSASSKSIGARDEGGDGQLNGDGNRSCDDEDGKLSSVSLGD